jgi:hypothetical protein
MSAFDLAERGIKRAEASADAAVPRWTDRAYEFLLTFLDGRRDAFSAPEVRAAAESFGLPVPPSKRAWGGPFCRAAAAGLIVESGYARGDRDMHCQPIRLWRRK